MVDMICADPARRVYQVGHRMIAEQFLPRYVAALGTTRDAPRAQRGARRSLFVEPIFDSLNLCFVPSERLIEAAQAALDHNETLLDGIKPGIVVEEGQEHGQGWNADAQR